MHIKQFSSVVPFAALSISLIAVPASRGQDGGGANGPTGQTRSTGEAVEPGGGQATLTMEPTLYDFAGTTERGLMYMPSSAELSSAKPDSITKEPTYRAQPRYAVISLGSDDRTHRVLAVDVPADESADAHIWLDLNGDGDLTNDNNGSWNTRDDNPERASSYNGTWEFDVGWTLEDGSKTTAPYGINFYYSTDRQTINYYRAAARIGQITIQGKDYEAILVENDNDARYNKMFDAGQVLVDPDQMTRPVWLTLDSQRFDIRGTFSFNGINYEAHVTDDGEHLRMTPTFRSIQIPRPIERPKMIAAGEKAPDFNAYLWTDTGEEQFSLSDFQGKKIVVLDFWASWCGPCKAGMPHLSKVTQRIQDDDVQVIAVNVFDEQAAYNRYREANDPMYAFTWARDPAGRESDASFAKRDWRVNGIPATFVINKDGTIVEAISGYTAGDHRLENALKELGVTLSD